MPKHKARLGLFPPLERWFHRRRVKKFERKLDDARDKFCDLAEQAEIEKAKAEHIFYKSEWDSIAAKLDRHMAEACDCSGKYKGKPSKEAMREAAKELEAAAPPPMSDREKCVDQIIVEGHKFGLFPKPGRTGKTTGEGAAIKFRTDALNPFLDECEKTKKAIIKAGADPRVVLDIPVAISGIRRAKGGRR
jgi:hypothetical protein